MDVCSPGLFSCRKKSLGLNSADVWSPDFTLRILQPEFFQNMSHSVPPCKTDTPLCLSLYIISSPLASNKCPFNENRFVSLLSYHLMAPALLQVAGRRKETWRPEAEPATVAISNEDASDTRSTCPHALSISSANEYLANPEVHN